MFIFLPGIYLHAAKIIKQTRRNKFCVANRPHFQRCNNSRRKLKQRSSSSGCLQAKRNMFDPFRAASIKLMSRLTMTTSLFSDQRRFMSKYLSKSATKRLALTTKRVKRGYKKGHGATTEGKVNSKGRFIVDHTARLQLILPDLEGFTLKPYIAKSVPKVAPELRRTSPRT